MIAARFETREATEDDFNRVGDKLTAFSREKQALDYEVLSQYFRAVVNGEVVGELIVSMNVPRGDAEVNLLHVEEQQRGKGIGSHLLEMAEDFARAHDATHIKIWTPDYQGEGFYEKHGYEEATRQPLRDGYADILYVKRGDALKA